MTVMVVTIAAAPAAAPAAATAGGKHLTTLEANILQIFEASPVSEMRPLWELFSCLFRLTIIEGEGECGD